MSVVEVFADVWCPFAHVGLRRLVERRDRLGSTEQRLRVRAWPLELVNEAPQEAQETAEKVQILRSQVAPDLFAGFDPTHFPSSTLPALDLAAAAYQQGPVVGEQVSLALRYALFEQGRDIGHPDVVRDIAVTAGVALPTEGARRQVLDDWQDGLRRGVIGSPHFFVGEHDYFCPSLKIDRVDGALQITSDPAAFDQFLQRCLDA